MGGEWTGTRGELERRGCTRQVMEGGSAGTVVDVGRGVGEGGRVHGVSFQTKPCALARV